MAVAAVAVALPQSTLHRMRGLRYRPLPLTNTLIDRMSAANRQVPGLYRGYVGRLAVETTSADAIATVQLVRFSPNLSKATLAIYQQYFIDGFIAYAKTTRERIAGRTVVVAPTARNLRMSVIGVADENDVVMFASPNLKALRRVVALYYA